MLKEHATVLRRVMMAADIGLGAVAFFLAYYLRSQMLPPLAPVRSYFWILPDLLFMWWFLLYFFKMYASFRLKSIPDVLLIINQTMSASFLLFGSLAYLLKAEHVSRSFILFIFILMTLLLVIEKMILVLFFRNLRKKGFNYRTVLMVGSGPRAQSFIKQIDDQKEFGLKIIGIVDDPKELTGKSIAGHPVMGTINDIPEILRTHSIDHVIFIVPRSLLTQIEQPILYCETVGVLVSVAVDLFDLQFTLGKESNMLGVPFISFESTPEQVWPFIVKRTADVILSAVGLVVLLPVYVIISIFIKATSPGPIYFTQERCGLQGRRFKLYKFRTMEQGAEAKLQQLLAHNEMRGPAFKMRDDPRITKIGKILRKTSMDELPQLWNVLKGDMSLVGPRPPLPREVEQYDHWHRRRLSMRPGITCIWQVSGRNQIIDFDKWMKLDMQYIDHWSLGLDFQILLKTLPAVISGAGAK